ncbi:hypothetical protein G3151_005243 [Salmonella enterica subsp. enterica serovar Montevideo]|nr:hypothetical protein [Salmonella enterica subsp. enterica serovar Montevideo]
MPLSIHPGTIDKYHFKLLLSLTSITSENIKCALEHYFVLGESRKKVCEDFGINSSYFMLKIRLIQDVSRTIVSLYPFYEKIYRETMGFTENQSE